MSTPIIIILVLAAIALIMAVILSAGESGSRVTIIKEDRDKVDDKDA